MHSWWIYQFVGSLRSLIFFRSSMHSRCGKVCLACRRKYGKMLSTKAAPWRMSANMMCKSAGKAEASKQNLLKLTYAWCIRCSVDQKLKINFYKMRSSRKKSRGLMKIAWQKKHDFLHVLYLNIVKPIYLHRPAWIFLSNFEWKIVKNEEHLYGDSNPKSTPNSIIEWLNCPLGKLGTQL